jgi:hypothetical protein
MSENTIVLVCIGGVIVVAVLIIVVANRLTARNNQKRADRLMKAMRDGTYDPKKKYMGNQGGWEPGEGPYDWNDYNRD